MPDLKKFRENVKRYRKRGRTAEGRLYTQEDLAKAIGLSADELGHRLNGNGRVPLSQENVFKVVLTLASWQTLNRKEAEELLTLMDYPLDDHHWKTELQRFLTPLSASAFVPSVGEDKGESNVVSPATKLMLLTCRDLAAHLCDMASMTMVVFPYGDHRPAGRVLEGRNEPRDVAVAGFERLTVGLRKQKNSGSKTKSLSDMAVEFYDMVKWDLDQIQTVLTPRLLGSAADQRLIDALIEFDHANRTLYSAILGHKLIVTQSAYFHIPNLIAVAGHLYRAMQPHWEQAEHDLAKGNGLANG